MSAYYNELDPYAAQWLRNLITAGHIAPGDVDERDIRLVHPDDLRGYRQCHFFAGIGVWSHALRLADWSDDREVWTGSCPCQPFSAAGKGEGTADARHLWPEWFRLIRECRPVAIFGEQVSAAIRHGWLDLVSADLESLDYACGAAIVGAHSVGAPHIRQRLYFVADSSSTGTRWNAGDGSRAETANNRARNSDGIDASDVSIARGAVSELADPDGRNPSTEGLQRSREHGQQQEDGGAGRGMADMHGSRRGERRAGEASDGRDTTRVEPSGLRTASDVGDTKRAGLQEQRGGGRIPRRQDEADPRQAAQRAGAPTHFWSDAEWLPCIDGKARPVSTKPQPLVDGSASSLGFLRAADIAVLEGEIDAAAMEGSFNAAEVLRDLQGAYAAESQRCWPPGGIPQLHEAPFLLAFLRQLTQQGWRFAERPSVPSAEAAQAALRGVRHDAGSPSAPRQHGLEGQPPGERADPVHLLSSLLARHAHSAWAHAYATYAEIGFPLAHNSPARVGRLRAYGNAICAPAAEEFIKGLHDMNDNVRIEAKLERLREFLRDWAGCHALWSPESGYPRAVNYLVDNMRAGVADSAESREGPNPWVVTVIETQLDNLCLRIPDARHVLLVRYLNKTGAAVYRSGRLCTLDQYAVDELADRVELELMPLLEKEGLPL